MNKSNIRNVSIVNFFKINKKGDYKYGIVLSLILGLMVLSLSMYFIFNEYFTSEDVDMEICRQSIQVRAALPDIEVELYVANPEISFKDDFPLKCKTMIKTIDEVDVANGDYRKIIGETMAECWALYGKGDMEIFPSDAYGIDSVCMPCARIHLTEDAKDYLRENNNGEINIRVDVLDERMDEGFSYYTYLQNSGKKFGAFDFGNTISFNLYGNSFSLSENNNIFWRKIDLLNRFNMAKSSIRWRDIGVSLPERLRVEDGDLMINVGMAVFSGEGEFGDYTPYLFYFQTGQEDNPFNEVKKEFLFSLSKSFDEAADYSFIGESYNWYKDKEEKKKSIGGVSFCENWEGIPA